MLHLTKKKRQNIYTVINHAVLFILIVILFITVSYLIKEPEIVTLALSVCFSHEIYSVKHFQNLSFHYLI